MTVSAPAHEGCRSRQPKSDRRARIAETRLPYQTEELGCSARGNTQLPITPHQSRCVRERDPINRTRKTGARLHGEAGGSRRPAQEGGPPNAGGGQRGHRGQPLIRAKELRGGNLLGRQLAPVDAKLVHRAVNAWVIKG